MLSREGNVQVKSRALLSAAKGNDRENAEAILASNDSIATKLSIVNAVDEQGCSALYWACVKGNQDIVDKLIAGGANMDQPVILSKLSISELFSRMCYESFIALTSI